MQPAIASGSGRRIHGIVPFSSPITVQPTSSIDVKPVENQGNWITAYERVFLKLLDLGIIDKNGLLTENYKDLELPQLKHVSERIKRFISTEIITIKYKPTQDGKEFVAQFPLAHFLGNLVMHCAQSEITFIKSIEIVGGKVASFLDWHYFKASIQKLLVRYERMNNTSVNISEVFTTELQKALDEELSSPCGDIDFRFYMPSLTANARDWLRNQMVYYIASITPGLNHAGITENCAFDNLGRIGAPSQPGLIVSVSNRNPFFEIQYDFLFHSGMARKFFAGRDALKVIVYDLGWLQEPKLESDFQKGWNFILSRCTRKLYIPNVEEVNEKGWGIYKSLELRSYNLVQEGAESKLLKRAIDGVPSCSDKGVYFCNQIWLDLIKHHHGSNPYDAILLFISFYNALTDKIEPDELSYFTKYVQNSLKELLLWIEHLKVSQPDKSFLQENIPILDIILKQILKENVTLEELINQLKLYILLEMTRPVKNRGNFKFSSSHPESAIEIFFVNPKTQKARRIALKVNPQLSSKEALPCIEEIDRSRSLAPTDLSQETQCREFWSKASVDVDCLTNSVEFLLREGKNYKLASYLSSALDIVGAPPKLYRLLVQHYPDLILSTGSVEERIAIHKEFDRLLERSPFRELRTFLDRCKPLIKDINLKRPHLQAEWALILAASKVKAAEGLFLEICSQEKCTIENVDYFSKLLLDHNLLQRFPGHPKITTMFNNFAQFIHDNPDVIKQMPKPFQSRLQNTFQQMINDLVDFPIVDPFAYIVGVIRAGFANPIEGYEIITQYLIKYDTGHDLELLELLGEIEERLQKTQRNRFHKTLFTIFFHADLKNRVQLKKELINFLQVTNYPYQKYLLKQIVILIEENLLARNFDEAFGLMYIYSETFQALSNDFDYIPLLYKLIQSSPSNVERVISLFEAYIICDERCWAELLPFLKHVEKPETIDRVYYLLLKVDANPTFQKDQQIRQAVWETVISRARALKSSSLLDILDKFQKVQQVFNNDDERLRDLSLAVMHGAIEQLNSQTSKINDRGLSLYNWYIHLIKFKLISYREYNDSDFQRDLKLIAILNQCNNENAPRVALRIVTKIYKHCGNIFFDENGTKLFRSVFKKVNENSKVDRSVILAFLKKMTVRQIPHEYVAFAIHSLNHLQDKNLRRLLLNLLHDLSKSKIFPRRDALLAFLDKEISSGRKSIIIRCAKCYLTLIQNGHLSPKEIKKYYDKLLIAFKELYEKKKTLSVCLAYANFLFKTFHLPGANVESCVNLLGPMLSDLFFVHKASEHFVETLSRFHAYYLNVLNPPASKPQDLDSFVLPEHLIPKESSYNSDQKTFLFVTGEHKALECYQKIKSFCTSLINRILSAENLYDEATKSIINFVYANLYQLILNHSGGTDDILRDSIRFLIFSVCINNSQKDADVHRNNIIALLQLAIKKGLFENKEHLIFRYGCWIESDEFESFSKSNKESCEVIFNFLSHIHEGLKKEKKTAITTHSSAVKAYAMLKRGVERWLNKEPLIRHNCFLKFYEILKCFPLAKYEGKFIYDEIGDRLLRGKFFQPDEITGALLMGSNLASTLHFLITLESILEVNRNTLNVVERYRLCITTINLAVLVAKNSGFDEDLSLYLNLVEKLLKHSFEISSYITDKSGKLLIYFSILLHFSFTQNEFNKKRVHLANVLIKGILKTGEKQLAAYIFQSLVENNVYANFTDDFKSMMSIVSPWSPPNKPM